jgi:hypothetical protein
MSRQNFELQFDIAENFAGMHRNEAHRRAFLATVDADELRRLVLDEVIEQLDLAVFDACLTLGYEEPSP